MFKNTKFLSETPQIVWGLDKLLAEVATSICG